jgi:dihydroneopterin aldolase
MTNIQPLRIADAAKAVRHVFIRNLEVLAHIGVYGHEQGKLQPVRINVDLAVEDIVAIEDKLDRVVDYGAIAGRFAASSIPGISTWPKPWPSGSFRPASRTPG